MLVSRRPGADHHFLRTRADSLRRVALLCRDFGRSRKDAAIKRIRRLATTAILALTTLNACSGGGSTSVPVTPSGGGNVAPASADGNLRTQTVVSATASTAAPTVLFADNFANHDYSQFTTLYGKWGECAGSTSLCSLEASDLASAGSATWGDYTASTAVTFRAFNTASNEKSGAELLFRLTDARTYYSFDLVRERNGTYQWQLWKVVAGYGTNLARGNYALTTGTKYFMSVSAIGSHFVASVSSDGGATYRVLGSGNDTTFATGKFGLRVFNSAAAGFDHVDVRSGSGTPAPSSPSPTASPAPVSSPVPYPTMTPIPPGSPPDNAYTIPAPSQPIPEHTPGPLCIAGAQYAYAIGDDFTQETQGQLNRYTTSWEINQYEYNGAKTNWVWSDQYSGIGRRNDFGSGDTYMVHIDDANPSRSYPASWVNSVSPRPGNLVEGAPPNAYLDIRAVAVPSAHVGDPSLNGAHWLTGALQSNKFTFGYTEALAQLPGNVGSWPAIWQLQVPGGGGYDGTGTSSTNYWEIDTLEKFGNIMGLDGSQQTTNSGRSNVLLVRPQTAGATTEYHSYGQLWVPPILGKPAYIVFYIDRKPTSYYLAPTGVGDMNMNVNLQMGIVGSFVGTPDPSVPVDLKVKHYFTWRPTGTSCGSAALSNPIPTPTPSAPPQTPPPVASNIVPKLQPYLSPVEVLTASQTLLLATLPANGDLLVAQGVSNFASCPTGFKYTGIADAFLCTAIVGQNGVVPSLKYTLGTGGFDIGALVDIHNVTSYTINPDIATGWHSDPTPTLTKSQRAPGANELALAFGFDITDSPRYPTSVAYTSNLGFNTIYRSDGNAAYGRGMTMMETKTDPYAATNSTVSFTGKYAWTGTPSSVGNDLLPMIVTILVR